MLPLKGKGQCPVLSRAPCCLGWHRNAHSFILSFIHSVIPLSSERPGSQPLPSRAAVQPEKPMALVKVIGYTRHVTQEAMDTEDGLGNLRAVSQTDAVFLPLLAPLPQRSSPLLGIDPRMVCMQNKRHASGNISSPSLSDSKQGSYH